MFFEVKQLLELCLPAVGKTWRIDSLLFETSTWTARYLVVHEQVLSHFSSVSVESPNSSARLQQPGTILPITSVKLLPTPCFTKEAEGFLSSSETVFSHLPDLWKDEENIFVTQKKLDRYWERDEQAESSLAGEVSRVMGSHLLFNQLIESSTGFLGRTDDLVIEVETMSLKYLIVTTELTHPRQVLVDPEWIDTISWETRTITLNDVSKEAIFLEASVNPNLSGDQKYQIEL